jgi:uncharacterized protein (DUF2267 family)
MNASQDQPAARNPASDNLAFDDPTANDPDPARSGPALQRFVEQVQRLAGLSTESEAETLTRATLSKLGERISSGQARDLTAALPAELAAELTSHATPQATAFQRDELLDQVSGVIHSVDIETVEAQVVAVLTTLKQWVPGDQLDDTFAQLPPDLVNLFG